MYMYVMDHDLKRKKKKNPKNKKTLVFVKICKFASF